MQTMTQQQFNHLKTELEKHQCSMTEDQHFIEKGEVSPFLVEFKNERLRILGDQTEIPVLTYKEPGAVSRFVAHIDKHMD